ncbi:MAG: UDP-N-acetyl-alpha-D-muramoyl-L-alanyl-L-glutamate epimerase [Trebonia sp.]|nr:UDP-N-acetyl-alpha-D-muramoyl-L-alanyl-L-glutamate epimerase [Trebonia sp.]
MNSPDAVKGAAPQRGQVFRYEGFATDAELGLLTCRYSLDGREFAERVSLAPGPGWDTPAAHAAARIVYLLAGVSYYKTAAPPVIDLGDTALTGRELAFLREFYLSGLGEYAYRNGLDLSDLTLRSSPTPIARECAVGVPIATPTAHPSAEPPETAAPAAPENAPAPASPPSQAFRDLRPLIPFGGGIDSIVTVEGVRQRTGDIALFVVSRPGDRFAAIEKPAAVSGLPILRAGREIDPQLLRSQELGFLNGHVPVTGIISAIAVLAATLNDRNAVVMSNEWSASVPTLEHNGQQVNHQWSKSAAFEASFRELLKADPAGLPDYFSALRDRTELWVAEKFARLTQYHGTFRSCNRAFHLDPERRLGHWCGQCDKCCFIDLILAPFMSADQLKAVFAADGGANAFDNPEPLGKPELKPKFRTLLGSGTKPFECVGEVNECRAAVVLAASRRDRADTTLLQELAAEVTGRPDAPAKAEIEAMRHPVGASFVPAGYSLGET